MTLIFGVLLSVLLAVWVYIDVHLGIGISRLNEPLFTLLRSLRIYSGEVFMLLATMLGDKFVLLPAAGLIFLWLVWKRYFWTAAHWLGLIVVSAGTIEFLKRLYFSSRPPGLLHGSIDSSFPSGHTLLSVSFFGFLTILILPYITPVKRKIFYLITSILCLWIALSRLYLGAHWLTDILISIFLGLALLFLATLSHRSRSHPALPYKTFLSIAAVITVCIWAIYGITQFHNLRYDYTLYWQKVSTNQEEWWQGKAPEIPLYIVSRLGKPNVILNVQWLGSLKDIEQTLTAEGWQTHPPRSNLQSAWRRLSTRNHAQHLPLLPELYQNQSPVLLLTRLDENHQQLSLMLWQSNASFTDTSQSLLLGNISYYIPHPHEKTAKPFNPHQLSILSGKSLQELMSDLKGQEFKILQVTDRQVLAILNSLHGDGKILLIRKVSSQSLLSDDLPPSPAKSLTGN